MKTIKYFTTCQYGCLREFVHPEFKADALLIAKLTGKKTIDPYIRELITTLSGGTVQFDEVIAPIHFKAPNIYE